MTSNMDKVLKSLTQNQVTLVAIAMELNTVKEKCRLATQKTFFRASSIMT
jgi:hypothetical protein